MIIYPLNIKKLFKIVTMLCNRQCLVRGTPKIIKTSRDEKGEKELNKLGSKKFLLLRLQGIKELSYHEI